jgi:N-acetylglucosamine-6-phosphate deacetylase
MMPNVPVRLFGHVLAPHDRGLAVVTVSGGRIAEITPATRRPLGAIGGRGLRLLPGLIDIQMNGAFGEDFSSPTAALARPCQGLPRYGVTAFLPTVISSPTDAYASCLENLRGACPSGGAVPIGVHVEGPFLSPARSGTHERERLREPSWSEVSSWLPSGVLRIVTMAPELSGALAVIRKLKKEGVVAAIGHSDATWGEARLAVEAGATLGTHLFNAMRPFSHHDPGIAGYLLASHVPVTVIADGIHLALDTLRLIARAKCPSELIVVTDALAGMGTTAPTFELAGQVLVRDGDVARRSDGTLSGSLLPLNLAVRNLVDVGVRLEDAVAAATANPARVIGDASRGRIRVGGRGDVVLMDRDWKVVQTLVGGKLAYQLDSPAPVSS